LVFEPDLRTGFWFGKENFPIPSCLRTSDGKVRGEFVMTLVYDPPLDSAFGAEYCRTNVEASLGTFGPDKHGKLRHIGRVPPEPGDINQMYEKNLVEHGFKWSPVKVYRKRIPRGVLGEEWRLRMLVQHRSDFQSDRPQPAALLVSVQDPDKKAPVYDDVVTAMARGGWVAADLQLRQGIRLRP